MMDVINALRSPEILGLKESEDIFFNSYKCRQLYCLIESKNFDPSTNWLSQHLNISQPELALYLGVLLRLGLIASKPMTSNSQGSASQTQECTYEVTKRLNSSTNMVRNSKEQHANLTRELLNEIREIGSYSFFVTLSTQRDVQKAFAQELKELVGKFRDLSKNKDNDLIYSFSFSATQIQLQQELETPLEADKDSARKPNHPTLEETP